MSSYKTVCSTHFLEKCIIAKVCIAKIPILQIQQGISEIITYDYNKLELQFSKLSFQSSYLSKYLLIQASLSKFVAIRSFLGNVGVFQEFQVIQGLLKDSMLC